MNCAKLNCIMCKKKKERKQEISICHIIEKSFVSKAQVSVLEWSRPRGRGRGGGRQDSYLTRAGWLSVTDLQVSLRFFKTKCH